MGYPGLEDLQLFRPKEGGCEYCKGRGIRGMVIILEILDTTEMEFRLALSKEGVSMSRLLEFSNEQKMRTLFDAAVKRIKKGEISVEDALATVHR